MTARQIPSGLSFWEEHLLPAVPEFKATFEEEKKWFDGAFLGHIMMWALTRFAADAWKNSVLSQAARHKHLRARKRGREAASGDPIAAANRELVERILAVLEDALAFGENDLQEMVLVSFLEDLPKSLDADQVLRLKRIFTPNLASGMKAVERFRSQPFWKDKSLPFEYLRWDPFDVSQGSPQ